MIQTILQKLKTALRSALPASLFDALIATYHLSLAYFGALLYGFPSRKLRVIGVTGTKGKSSTTEIIASIFEAHGEKVALLNSIRIKIGSDSRANEMRMSMPGRSFIQSFLAEAVRSGATIAVLEMTSEGARQHRHRAIALDALIFTNLAPEHIESHGSYEAYADAKFQIGLALARSKKRPRVMVANADDAQSARYLLLPVEAALPFSLSANAPYSADERGGFFTFDSMRIETALPGIFSLQNALAAATLAHAFGVPTQTIATGIAKMNYIPGRAERIEEGQDFTVIVDYAHTPDSLEAIYSAYPMPKIGVLGSMGGSRDTWNRPEKARIAATHCRRVILTNEDPCDDDPKKIVEEMMRGIPEGSQAEIIIDRREAIRAALEDAKPGEAVIITGKGTDPWIYGAKGEKIPWSDAKVAREELQRVLFNRSNSSKEEGV